MIHALSRLLRRREPRGRANVPCIGCGSELIRYLWIDIPAALRREPMQLIEILGVCSDCRTEQDCETHIRLPEDRTIRGNHAWLLALRYTAALRRTADRRDASSRAGYWQPARPPAFRTAAIR